MRLNPFDLRLDPSDLRLDRSELITRRRALWLMGMGGAALLAADAASPTRAGMADQGQFVVRPATHATPPPRRPTPRPASWTSARLAATTPKKPISDLRQLVPPPPGESIALTLDDGPDPRWTPRILDLLDEHDVRATFFAIGSQVKRYPKITRRIVDAGHQICNHTMNHPISFRGMSRKRLETEIGEAHDRIAQVSGVVPTFFRAPGGNWTPRVLDVVAEHGMLPLDWAVDPRDWSRPGVGRIRKALLKCEAGNILLVHDGGGDRSQTLKALRSVIPELKKRGMTFVSL